MYPGSLDVFKGLYKKIIVLPINWSIRTIHAVVLSKKCFHCCSQTYLNYCVLVIIGYNLFVSGL